MSALERERERSARQIIDDWQKYDAPRVRAIIEDWQRNEAPRLREIVRDAENRARALVDRVSRSYR